MLGHERRLNEHRNGTREPLISSSERLPQPERGMARQQYAGGHHIGRGIFNILSAFRQ